MSERIHWPKHCTQCPFRTTGPSNIGKNPKADDGRYICGYCLMTGKSLIKEYGRIGSQAIRDVCQHYKDDLYASVKDRLAYLPRGVQRTEANIARRHEQAMSLRNKLYDDIKKLYEQGLNDCQIGRELQIRAYRVYNWRRANNLPSNTTSLKGMTEEEKKARQRQLWRERDKRNRAKRLENDAEYRAKQEAKAAREALTYKLYKEGKNDHEIAVAVGRSDCAIQAWRTRRHLPHNFRKKGASNHGEDNK